MLKKLLIRAFCLFSLSPFALAQTGQVQLTSKDIAVHPFCTIAEGKKIDPKSKGVFDELKVIVTSEKQSTRVRLSGKKKNEGGTLEGRPALHTGKVFLVPFAEHKGILKFAAPSIDDVCRYFVVLELPDNALQSKEVKFEKGPEYQWSITKSGDQVVFSITKDGTEVTRIAAAADKVKSFGLASTVRSKGNESDLSMTIQ